MADARARVLCVDDEPQVLEGLTLHLRRRFDVATATSGALGLELIASGPPFAVVLSDMRMPKMDGAAFLARVRQAAPDTVRMLLTGQTDIQSAVAAVNDGQIFRFLTKPCPPDKLVEATAAAAEHSRLLRAERDLLENTLRGSIKALTDVLSLTNPVAFGRAARIKQHVVEMCDALDVRDRWFIEVAAMVSQLGCVTLPPSTAEKLYFGAALSPAEEESVRQLPGVARRLLGHIPRLEPVLELLASKGSDASARAGGKATLAHDILALALEYDALESRGTPAQLAIDTLRGRAPAFDARALDALAAKLGAGASERSIRELALHAVRVGMVFADDVRTSHGTLLVARGYEVTEGFVERAKGFERGQVKEPVRVFLPAAQR